MRRSRTMHGPIAVALICGFLAPGCASAPRPELTIHNSPRGSVYLERIPDTSFQATHPITLNSGTIAQTLRGIHVQDDRHTLQSLFATKPMAVRAFSDEEADFLAPFISTALAKASPDQRIGFRINQTASPSDSQKEGAVPGRSEPPVTLAPEEITSGVLFAYGRSLQLHLTRFRSGFEKRSMIDGPNRHYSDQTGLTGRKLVFLPDKAQRPDAFRMGETDASTLVIDYELLARLPDQPTAPAPGSPAVPGAAPPTEASPVQPAAAQAATVQEVEALKKELQEIKRQLNEQQSKKDHSKKRPPAQSAP